MAIEWRADLATGNEEIDTQHQELFRRFNNLLTSCNQGKGKEEVCGMLIFLGDYVRSHFAAEERVQIQHRYPGYRAHKEQHDQFIADLRNLEDEMNKEGATISLVIQTNQTIVNWLIKHISSTDRALGTFLLTVNDDDDLHGCLG